MIISYGSSLCHGDEVPPIYSKLHLMLHELAKLIIVGGPLKKHHYVSGLGLVRSTFLGPTKIGQMPFILRFFLFWLVQLSLVIIAY